MRPFVRLLVDFLVPSHATQTTHLALVILLVGNFAVLMLRNAHLTPDTMNSLVFQLTSTANNLSSLQQYK